MTARKRWRMAWAATRAAGCGAAAAAVECAEVRDNGWPSNVRARRASRLAAIGHLRRLGHVSAARIALMLLRDRGLRGMEVLP